jgi:YHS domain-containing protein
VTTRKDLVRTFLGAAIVALGMAAVVATPALAIDPVYSNWRGLALRGYDPVAYFTEGKAVEGSSEFTVEWKGATWRFASAANRDRFAGNPSHYAPQYGGYCAYAVAKGDTASIDPEAWRIIDGKLYLNYSREIQAEWEKDIPGYIAKADQNWPKLLGE